MLNMAGVNAVIIKNSNNRENMKRHQFLKNLGLALVNQHISLCKDSVNLPRAMRKRMKEFTGETSGEPPAKLTGVRRSCQDCPYKKIGKLVTYVTFAISLYALNTSFLTVKAVLKVWFNNSNCTKVPDITVINIPMIESIETLKAGSHWLQSFPESQLRLSVRQAESLSLARAQGLNLEEGNKIFKLLLQVLTEYDLLDKPDRIFDVDETVVQLNNKPGKVIVTKGAKSVHSVTSGDKVEILSVIAYCNATENFLSPLVIIKGVNRKLEKISRRIFYKIL
ncbi:unnamed protein product [Euphydryas editha]|uniref:Transposase n=1 Tax=Euphydryas editha TaxID=104508 RepID=A0AAU9TN84_EUPED|nr:unnamed protein product [Euphydryas editha]